MTTGSPRTNASPGLGDERLSHFLRARADRLRARAALDAVPRDDGRGRLAMERRRCAAPLAPELQHAGADGRNRCLCAPLRCWARGAAVSHNLFRAPILAVLGGASAVRAVAGA